MKKSFVIACLMILSLGIITRAQTVDVPKVYIVPMENNFHTFLAAAFVEKKLSLKLVLDDESAEYVITGGSVKGDNKWHDTVFGTEKDRNQGSIMVIKKSDKSVAWAGAAGDKSLFVPGWIGSGQKKVANRLADKLKKELFKPV